MTGIGIPRNHSKMPLPISTSSVLTSVQFLLLPSNLADRILCMSHSALDTTLCLVCLTSPRLVVRLEC